MTIFTKYSFRITIPLVLIIIAIVFQLFLYLANQKELENDEEKNALSTLTYEANQLQDILNYRARINDLSGMKSTIARGIENPNINTALLLDENNIIIASSNFKFLNKPIDSIFSIAEINSLKKIREALRGEIVNSKDRNTLSAFYPIILGSRVGEIRPRRIGICWLKYDLKYPKELRKHQLGSAIIFTTIVFLCFFLMLGIFLHYLITKRAKKLVTTTKRFANGNFLARSTLVGNDELAQLGNALNKMIDTIEEQKKVITEKEANYKQIVDTANEGIWIIDENDKITFVNTKLTELLGYSLDEMIGKNINQFIIGKAVKINSLTPEIRESRFIHKNGEGLWMMESSYPIFDNHDRHKGSCSMFNDITDQKKSEQILRASESKFRSMFQNTASGMVIVSPNFEFIQVNNSFCNMLGYSEDELIGQSFQNVTHPEDRPICAGLIGEILDGTRESVHFEKRYLHKNGKIIWGLVSAALVRDVNNKPINFITQIVNITDRKVAEEILRQNENILNTLLNGIPESALLIDNQGKILTTNDTFEKIINKEKNELIGENIFDLLPPEVSSSRKEQFNIVLKTKKPIRFQDVRFGRNIDNCLTPILNKNGEVTKVALIGFDITHRIEIEKALRDSKELLSLYILHSPVYTYIKEVSEKESKVLEASDSFVKMIGIPAEQMIGKSMHELFPAEFARKITADDWDVVSNGKILEIDEELNGRYYVTIKFPISKDDKYLLAGYTIDITERKHAEQKLRKSEERFKRLFDCASDSYFIFNKDGFFIDANQAACLSLGYTLEEIKKMNVSDIEEEIKKFDINILLHRILEGINETKEGIHKRKNGTTFPVEVHVTALNIDDEQLFFASVRDITQRKTAEKLLEENERRLSLAINATADAIWEWDLRSNKTYYSPRWFEMLGYEDQEIEMNYDSWKHLCHPEDYLQAINKIQETLLSKERVGYISEFRMKHKDGTWRWILGRGNVVQRDYNEQPMILSGTNTDITERKNAEAALAHSHELMSYIIEHNRSAVAVHDKEMKYIYVSKRYLDDYKIIEKDIIGRHHYDVFPDLPQKWRDVHKRVLNGEILSAEDDSYPKDDGTIEWTRWECRPWYEVSGEIGGLIVYTEVITERKKTEEALKQSEKKYREMIENLSIGFYSISLDGYFLNHNPEFLRIAGYNPDASLIGKPAVDFWQMESDRDSYIKELREKGFVYNYIVEGKNGNGEKKFIELNARLIKDNDNNPVKVEGTAVDITERRQTETELEAYRNHLEELVEARTEEIDAMNRELINEIKLKNIAEKKLEEALLIEKELNDLKSRFISTTSHEFRTPLTAVLTSTEMIQRYFDKWGREKVFEHLDRIKYSAGNLTKLMEDIITVNKAESGKVVLNPVNVDVKDLCMKIIESFLIHTNENQKLVFDYLCNKNDFILDPKQLELILDNLVSNAIKYSPEGGRIGLTVSNEKDRLNFLIADEGIGIPKDEIPYLFESFHRATNVDNIKGTGLGLTIVKYAVEISKWINYH